MTRNSNNKGWPREPIRHSLSSKGIPTTTTAKGVKSTKKYMSMHNSKESDIVSGADFEHPITVKIKDGDEGFAMHSIETIVKAVPKGEHVSSDLYGTEVYVIQLMVDDDYTFPRDPSERDTYITFFYSESALEVTDTRIELGKEGRENLKKKLDYLIENGDDEGYYELNKKLDKGYNVPNWGF